MPPVRLSRFEAEEGPLPSVCVLCGADAVAWKRRQFGAEVSIHLPFCAAHRHHWTRRALFAPLSLAMLIGLSIAGLWLEVSVIGSDTMWSCLGACLGAVVWLIVSIGVEKSAVRATGVGLHGLTLTRASPQFIAAVEEQRRQSKPRPAAAVDLMHKPWSATEPPAGRRVVRLGRFEAQRGELPSICMCCGAPASERRRKTFSWRPSWVLAFLLLGPLPYLIAAVLANKRALVYAPVCERHFNYWAIRQWIVWGSLAALIVLGVGGMVVVDTVAPGGPGKDARGLFCFGVLVLAFAWLVVAMILDGTIIRAREISDHTITLERVSPAFARAVSQQHRDEVMEVLAVDEPRRPPAPGRGDQFYDPKRP